MAADQVEGTTAPDQSLLTVELAANEVDAGAELSLSARASCPHGCDLRGKSLYIRDATGKEVASALFTEVDEGVYTSEEASFTVPVVVGTHSYVAAVAAHQKDGVEHEGASSEFTISVKAHAATLNAWAVPSAIVAGEPFKFKASIKCSSGCKLAGRELSIFDHEGVQVGTGVLQPEVWPGTAAVYFTEVEGRAPLVPGDHRWEVRSAESATGIPHQGGSYGFLVRTLRTPDFELKVEAIDHEKQTPIKGAQVTLHPYRSVTDENGVARVKVIKGSYKLFVTGFDYIGFQTIVDVTEDVTIRAELVVEKAVDPYDEMY